MPRVAERDGPFVTLKSFMADDLNSRVDRLEEHERHIWAVLDALSVKQQELDEVLAAIADAQAENAKRFRETEQRFRETEQRFRETDERFREVAERFRETDERFRETDARIDKLVSAIGEFIRRDGEK
jgi:chromosome segregation ATPase